MTRAGILSLSVELLVEILSYLNHDDLLHCRQVSRVFGDIIRDTSALQYTLELGLTGYDDGVPRSKLNVVQRLAMLRHIQRSWRNPRPTFQDTLAVPSKDWIEARWFKDVLVGRIPGKIRQLDVFYLSSVIRDEERSRTLRFDVDFDAAYVDPGQDLVVLTRSAFGPNHGGLRPPPRIYLRSLRSQGPHPRAHQSYIDLAGYGFPEAPFARRVKIQVSGEYLAVTVSKQLITDAILVWHWPSGTINAFLRPHSHISYLSAFCTPTGFLLVNQHRKFPSPWFGILVYHLPPESETPRLLASFALPTLNWDPSSLLNSTFYPSSNRHGTPGGSLSSDLGHKDDNSANTNYAEGRVACSPGYALVQLKMDLQYTLYTPLSTFISVAENALREIARGHTLAQGSRGQGFGKGIQQEANVPWEEWAHRARIIEEGNDSAIVCGYRAVYTDHILDFSPFDVATDTYGSHVKAAGGEVQANEDAGIREGEHGVHSEVVTEPSTLQASMFAKPVMTKLPYRRSSFPFPGGMGRLSSDMVQIVLEDVDGPKILRATCKDFVLVPTSVDVYTV